MHGIWWTAGHPGWLREIILELCYRTMLVSFHEESRLERLEVLCDTGQESWWLNKGGSGKEEDPRARQEVEPTDLGEGSEESWRDLFLSWETGWGVGPATRAAKVLSGGRAGR